MPQLVPFYFINEITFAFVLLVAIVYIYSLNTLPRFVRLFVARTFVTRVVKDDNAFKSSAISNARRLEVRKLNKTPKELLTISENGEMIFNFKSFKAKSPLKEIKKQHSCFFMFDINYAEVLKARLLKLKHNKFEVLAVQGPKAQIRAQKLLIFICDNICEYHTEMFEFQYINNEKHILNKVSGHSYKVNNSDPLLIIASLIIEDVNIVMSSSNGFILVGTLTLNPVGWPPSQRMRFNMSKIHAEVPNWDNTFGRALDSGFKKTLKDYKIYMRTAKFYQIKGKLMRLAKNPTCNFKLIDFVILIVTYIVSGNNRSFKGLSFIIKRYLVHGTITKEDIYFRVEVQHIFTIPGEDFVCFTVRTFIFSYASLDSDEKAAFKANLPRSPEMWDYHGINAWYYLLEEEEDRKKK